MWPNSREIGKQENWGQMLKEVRICEVLQYTSLVGREKTQRYFLKGSFVVEYHEGLGRKGRGRQISFHKALWPPREKHLTQKSYTAHFKIYVYTMINV